MGGLRISRGCGSMGVAAATVRQAAATSQINPDRSLSFTEPRTAAHVVLVCSRVYATL